MTNSIQCSEKVLRRKLSSLKLSSAQKVTAKKCDVRNLLYGIAKFRDKIWFQQKMAKFYTHANSKIVLMLK